MALIIRGGQPSGIGLARGGGTSAATKSSLSFPACTEGEQHLMHGASTGIRAGSVSRLWYLAGNQRIASGTVDTQCVRVVEIVDESGRGAWHYPGRSGISRNYLQSSVSSCSQAY